MLRNTILAAALVMTDATGCSRAEHAASATTTTVTPAATATSAAATIPASESSTLSNAPVPVTEDQHLVAGRAASIAVVGDPLPRNVTDAILAKGGELVDPGSWDSRYGTVGLPRITGTRVRLVEASIDARRMTNGWQRTDELQWLFEDTSHNGLDDLLDNLAAAAGIASWSHAGAPKLVDGADCATRTYTQPGDSTEWRLQGCAYPKFPGMYAVGVGRDGLFADGDPQNVEPTAQQVAAAVDGRIDAYTVTFGRPAATGSVSTLRTTVTVSYTGDARATADNLVRGPLAGWQRFPGDASIMLSGSSGTSWVIGSGTATFDGQGRLQP
jgi:hypothetical protein